MGLRTQKRRRRENKTDYKLRLKLLESDKQRIVIRKTNKYFIVQFVKSDEAKDKVLVSVCSKDLLNNGWDKKFTGSLKSISAGYLTGLLAAKKLGKDQEKKGYILDLGLLRTIHGSRIYAIVKGLVDGGVNINVNEKIFPSEERLNGEHLKADSGIKEMIAKVKSSLIKEGK